MSLDDMIKKAGHPLIVAELSANHAGSLQVARDTLRAMADAGADAVKLQTYTPDSLTLNVKAPDFRLHGGLWDGRWLYDLYIEGGMPYEWHQELFELAADLGMICFSTPFDREGVDLLKSLDNPIYKIASFEIMDLELIEYAARQGRPMVMSTGIATDREILEAVETCRHVGNDDITLLKCTSAYPAQPRDANLAMIPAMRKKYGVNVGLSDHSPGSLVPALAVQSGAVMIEKHFILDRSLPTPDAAFSMTPEEFAEMVRIVKGNETLEIDHDTRAEVLGSIDFDRSGHSAGRQWARSLYVSAPIHAGETFTRDNVKCVRPGHSLHPRHLSELLGTAARHDYTPGDRLNDALLDNSEK